ncbi:MAG: GAF domain-containing protein, partial [Candidatus Eremiobacteraeota bacterium]|nr:GAF domain-containing protein [Candidatus Eremiobacteraeota bacterium]
MKAVVESDLERDRQATVDHYRILDTPEEAPFDELVRLASYICGTPIAAINIVDEEREWSKARVGLDFAEIPRAWSICDVTVSRHELLVVPDTMQDERFSGLHVVTGDPYIRFYAGAPLIAPNGRALGTICVADKEPRELSPMQAEALVVLSRHVVNLLELRRITAERVRTDIELRREQDYAERSKQYAAQVLATAPLRDERKHRITTREFDLHALVEQSMDLFVGPARSQGIDIGCSIHGGVPRAVRGDETRLRQILVNLLGYAVRRREVSLDIDLVERAEHASVIRFSVSDGGESIVADAGTGAAGAGSELATARKLVELMGGEIGFASPPGRGSTAWFTLRLDHSLQHAAADGATKPSKPRALLVGVPGAAANTARRALEKGACVLAEVETGRAAIEV